MLACRGRAEPAFGVPANVGAPDPSDIVKKISFTGSIPVGKHLAGLAARV